MTIRPLTLINEKYLAEYSPLPKNYDYTEIWNYVPIVEQLYIIPILGKELYKELITQVKEDTLTDVNSALIMRVWQYEGICTVYEALPIVAYHLSQTGITKGKSENSDSVDTKDINFLSTHLNNQMVTLQKNLIQFLEDNAELYPLYVSTKDSCPCTPPKNTNIFKQTYSTKRHNVNID